MPSHYNGTEEELRALNLFITLNRGYECFSARVADSFAQEKLTPSQFGVLETLYHLGQLTSSQIAEKHLRSRNNLSVVIANLERDGLVARVTCPSDRRAHYIELTDEGRSRIEAVMPKFVASLVKECGALSPEEQEWFRALMKKLGKSE